MLPTKGLVQLQQVSELVMERDPDSLRIDSEKGKVIVDHPSCEEISLTPEEALEAADRLAEEAALAEGRKHVRE